MNAALNGTDDALYSRLTVTDQSVSWPDDGDYLVFDHVGQDVVSFGGTSAELQPGVYGVFNVTTGERSDIAVGDVAGGGTRARKEASEDDEESNTFVGQPGSIQNDDGSVTFIVTHGPGYHEITVTPEESWSETFADAGWGVVGGAIGGAGVFGPGGIVPVGLGAGVGTFGNAVDIEHEWHPPAWMTWLADVLTPEPRPPLSVVVYPEQAASDSQGEVSSADSAEDAGFGTDEEGEFGGTPTQPAAESQSASPSRPATTRSSNENSENDRSSRENNSQSSRDSAESAGFGTSEQGEFG